MVAPEGVQVVGIAWYPADQYVALRALMKDGHRMPATHVEWETQAEALEQKLRGNGQRTVRALLDVDAFRQFVDRHGLDVDAKGRMAFANWCAQQAHRNGDR